MTYDDIVIHARSRSMEFGATFPTTARVLWRRIEIRQQEIFSQANRVNPDYFGVASTAPLDATFSANLKGLEASVGVDPASNVSRVEIEDAGTHATLVMGDQVNIVSAYDIEAELAPRMTLRNFILKPVGAELNGVISICVLYGYRPENKKTLHDGTETAELPDVYQELLVYDLAKFALKQTLEMDAEVKAAALAVLQEEEDRMVAALLAEVADFAGVQVSRFGAVVGTQRL